MPTYTPQAKQDEVATSAFDTGMMYCALATIPSVAGVAVAMKYSPRFVKATNFQSRTALAIMPPLFVFGLTSEKKLEHEMKQMAHEGSAAWNQEQEAKHREEIKNFIKSADQTKAMMDLYRSEVEASGVRIVPGDNLGLQHRALNYWQANPFKMLAAAGVSTVLYIFKGKSNQSHLQLQSKIMHTRVYGQFAVIGLLLGFMGVKTYMDTEGTYITEAQAEAKAAEMARKRDMLLSRIEFNKKLEADRKEMIRKAHDIDVQHSLQDKVASLKTAIDAGDHSHAH
mmetsp:Transcript_13862/g.23054  ORF Transcript_13862/g.23054 Transcript_13862/m.23054 type:complete len:283 (-) Transcript_13862:130-978(-)